MRSNGQQALRANENGSGPITSARLAELVEEVLVPGIAREIEKHHRDGHPVTIWEDGQVVLLFPDGTTRPVDEAAAAKE